VVAVAVDRRVVEDERVGWVRRGVEGDPAASGLGEAWTPVPGAGSGDGESAASPVPVTPVAAIAASTTITGIRQVRRFDVFPILPYRKVR
jgi:hypothetical protein